MSIALSEMEAHLIARRVARVGERALVPDYSRLTPSRHGVPGGDVTLPDGRILRRMASMRLDSPVPSIARLAACEHGVWKDRKGLVVIAAVEPGRERWLLHVSVSYAQHNPSWKELHLVKRAFFGDEASAMQVLPRESHYVNVQEHCFHLWEMPPEWEDA